MTRKSRKQKSRPLRNATRRKDSELVQTSRSWRILSKLTSTLKWTGLSLLALAALLFLINAFDQDIRPEAETFGDFSSEQVPPKQNAFLAVVGHTAPLTDDPLRKGVEIVDEYNRRVAVAKEYDQSIFHVSDTVLGPRALKFKGDATKLCVREAKRCLPEYRREARMVEQMSRDNRQLLERYRQLYGYPHYRETAIDSIYVFSPYGDSQTNSLNRALIGLEAVRGNARSALDALRRDTRYHRLVLRESRTLIAKMISVSRIKRNLTLLSEIIATTRLGRKEHQIANEILTFFEPAELEMERPFRSEFNFARHTFQVGSDWGQTEPDMPEQPWWTDIANVFFKKNATINLMYERNQALAELGRLPPNKLMEELTSGRANDFFQSQWLSWHSVYNPLGKTLSALAGVETWTNYIARVHNTDALMRLVTLQLAAKESGVREQDLPQFLAQADSALRNPYFAEPARWDADTHSFYFLCLRESENAELMSQRVEVFLSPEGQ